MNKRVGVVGFIVENNSILLANIEYAPNDRKWTGIGGYIDKNELPEEAAIREFNEETFINVKREDLVRVKELEFDDYRLIVFKANRWTGELKIKDPTIKELRWFKSDKIPYNQMYEGNEKWIPELFK